MDLGRWYDFWMTGKQMAGRLPSVARRSEKSLLPINGFA
jgi:hypothetical protein